MELRIIAGLFALLICTKAATIDNGVTGDPEIECSSDSILVNFNTEDAFEGHVYVKGHYDEAGCRTDATLSRQASITIPFSACGVRRQRSSNPKGLYVGTTVVITFHAMFITMVDKAYNVKCFYMESDKTVSADLDVSLNSNQHEQILIMLGGKRGELESLMHRMKNSSVTPDFDLLNMLTTAVITQNIPMPTCKYEVLENDADGEVVRFASVGDQVFHQWSCTPEDGSEGVYCMTVHTCTVQNDQGKEVRLLDENGCALDRYLLLNLNYTDDLVGGQTSMVFKFADQTSLFFHCQIRLTLKDGDTCERTSDECVEPTRGKRAVSPLHKRQSIPANRRKRSESEEEEQDGEDVDVFSASITVFEIDDPIAQKLDASEISALNRRTRQRVVEPEILPGGPLCLSAITFGILIAVLAVVLLASLVTVGLLCCRRDLDGLKQLKP